MNPDERSLKNSNIFWGALGRISPQAEKQWRDLCKGSSNHDINQDRQQAFGAIANKRGRRK